MYPLIAPPTPHQLEADKAEIDASFEKAFAILDQLSKDTDSLKASEIARTERLDTALAEVESVIGELKTASRRREEETRRTTDEVRGLKDLIPKAIEGNKEATDMRLKELNTELKSLKTLMAQRMNPAQPATYGSNNNRFAGTSPNASGGPQQGPNLGSSQTSSTPNSDNATKPATGSGGPTSEATPSPRPTTSRVEIPAWQKAAVKSSPAVTTTLADSSKEGSSGSAS